ncbi:hypothetical protein JCM18918_1023 [Cutibacterium acnes JCM 18918]|nr:hypothetical protein JCM18918_1023 [Cutibacterium acnes JCM 18918]
MWSITRAPTPRGVGAGYVVEHCLLAGTSDGGFDARAMGMEKKYRGVVRVRLLPQGDSPALGERNLCEHEHQVTCGTGEETL